MALLRSLAARIRHSPRAATALAGILAASFSVSEEPPRIGRVIIRTVDVFSPEEAQASWLHRAANSLHVVTYESVVRKYLLFGEGDPYDPALLAESERNLRSLGLFRNVSIVAGEEHDGVVDVEVVTQDAWTTKVGLSVGSGGGQASGGITLGDSNFLGSARQVSIGYGRDTLRSSRFVEILDPSLFSRYGRGHLLYSDDSDGRTEAIEIARPFYSIGARWAAQAIFRSARHIEELYAPGGTTFSSYRSDRLQALLAYGLALRASDVGASRLTLGLDWQEARFSDAPGRSSPIVPRDRRFRYLFAEYELIRNDFLKLDYVNHDVRFEDFNLGHRLSVRGGVSPAVFGLERTTGFARVQLDGGQAFGPRTFIRGTASWEARIADRLENAIAAAEAVLVHRFATTVRQTFVVHLAAARGWNLDGDVQFFADGETGLRGYRLHAFEGDKKIVLNLEHRIFSGQELFHLVSPGVAVFIDAGTAEPPGKPLRLSGVKLDAGAGLRFALAWAPVVNIFRIDAAYAFQRDALGHRGWLISFSAGQAF